MRSAGAPGPQHPDVEGRALGSAALAYFLSAGSENIGLSSQAAEQLRNGCIEVRSPQWGLVVKPCTAGSSLTLPPPAQVLRTMY